MTNESLEAKVDALKKSIDTLVLIEVAKAGATRDQARSVLGSLSNKDYSKVSALFSAVKGKK